MKSGLLIFALALGMLASSCMVGPNYTTPKAEVADQWVGSAGRPSGAADAYWWRSFDDPVLNQLIDSAYRSNLSLQIAGVRVLEARASLNRAIGNLFPQQQAVSGLLDYTSVGSKVPAVSPDVASAQALFAASWEIDFWGKYRRGIESEEASFLGSMAAYDDVLVTLVADVAASYLNIRTLEERLRVAARNVDLQKESLRIATARFKGGETSERDLQQAATQLAQTEAQVPRLEETLRQTKNGLAVLMGVTPDQVDKHLAGSSRIPPAPPGVAIGIPKDLLRRRPDVRAAGMAAASLSALIGVAESNLYPSFSLTGQFGFSANNAGSTSIGDLFSWQSRALSIGGGFFFPIFNYGRIENQVRVQDAQFQAAVLNYQNTVLLAQQEVEDGLAAFAYQQQAVLALARAAEAARRSTNLAMLQYKGGQTDYTTVLSAEQAQLTVEDSLASARGGVVLGLVSVYRALGGGWEIREGHDVVSDEVKAEMARRTDWGKMLEPSRHLPKAPAADVAAEAKGGK